MTISENVPEIAKAFPIGTLKAATPLTTGLIHATFRLTTDSGDYILSRVSDIFTDDLFADIEAVTKHLQEKGVVTFSLIRANDGALFHRNDAGRWRLITALPGETLSRAPTLEELESAGALIGEFHAALSDYQGEIRHRLPGFHDTPAYMERLRALDVSESASLAYPALHALTQEVLAEYAKLPAYLQDMPLRVLHGDPQLVNVLFKGGTAYALIDLDTVGRYPLTTEVGDMLRACSDAGGSFNEEAWRATLKGYLRTAAFITPEERRAIPDGVAQISLELTARFIIDAYEERYFALDATKYDSLAQQNTALAEYWMRFYRDFRKKQPVLS